MGFLAFWRRFFTCEHGKFFVIKELLAYVYLKYFQKRIPKRFDVYEYLSQTDIRKVNVLPPTEETLIERRRSDTLQNNIADCLLFFGFGLSNEQFTVKISQFGTKATIWVILRLSNEITYTIPVEKVHNVPRTTEDCFAASGLRLRCILPMRKWRISFNGMLRSSEDKRDVHVKFSFIWTASSKPFDTRSDIPIELQSDYLAKQTWNGMLPDTKALLHSTDAYDQSGNMVGTVTIGGEESPRMVMFGGRLRTAEFPYPDPVLTRTSNYMCYMKDGDYFNIYECNLGNTKTPYRFGTVVHSNSVDKPFETVNLNENGSTGAEIEGFFVRRKEKIEFQVEKPYKTVELVKSDFASRRLHISFCQVKMNGDEGNMMILRSYHEDTKDSYSENSITEEEENRPNQSLVVNITESHCRNVEQTGGKGSSLAYLTKASLEDDPFQFKVPIGVVLTTTAYEHFLRDNGIRQLLSELKFNETVYGQVPGNVEELCKKVVTEISAKLLSHKIEERLEEKMREVFNEDIGNLLFAVRSSAAGEDSEDLSAAGQMDTFLGVRGLEEINTAIIKCWASQFSYTAIQYKKQNGQELNSPMAVVVQQIVPADQAGVMFTSDPVTGDPSLITITANYGLGESVVSATADPDVIVIKRDVHGHTKLKQVQVGQKAIKTVLSENGGVSENQVQSMEKEVCCVSSEMALRIARIGIKVENLFGCPLDIEWATWGEQVYLLQARPVTTFDRETETEIIHESDVYLRCGTESFSKANVGEVMPGAMTDLGGQFLLKMLDVSMRDHWTRANPNNEAMPYNPYIQKGVVIANKHVFFALVDSLYRFESEKNPKAVFTSAYEIALFGRVLDDPDLREKAIKRNKNYGKGGGLGMIIPIFKFMVQDFLMVGRNLRRAAKIIHNYNLEVSEDLSATEYYEQTLIKLLELASYGKCHTGATIYSTMFNLWLLTTLAKGNEDRWDEVVYGDFAALLSSCEKVESADVPSAMNKLATAISKSIDANNFCGVSTELALEWLQTSETEAAKQFRDFLLRHGHRCVKEFDVHTKPWGVEPLSLVKTLQDMVRVGVSENEVLKPKLSTSELLNKLKVPLTWKRRLFLKYLIPYCQTAVGYREQSKSVLIRIVDHFRKKFSILADKMVTEGRLPERDLFYFLNMYEISVLLKTRSPKLVQKATRRKNMHKDIDALRFPEIIKGLPVPINCKELSKVVEGSLILKGTPVSQGVVTGPVRVATNLEEASQIQPGEILVAYSTDIGWSPYFPMLIGVATELGGLVSHGAVVAREYGLPCVVSLHGATIMFHTGDIALLDGNKGVLKRIDN